MRRTLKVLLVLVALSALPPAIAVGSATLPPEYQVASVCGYCHDALYTQFQGSLHDRAAVDLVYLYEVRLAQKQTDGLVGPFCLKCHSPAGHLRGETSPPAGEGDGSTLSAQGKAGVTCDFCHTIEGKEKGRIGNGSFVSDPGLVKRGPWGDSLSPGHETAESALHQSSEVCGVCHDVYHPANGLPLEATYTEWKSSDWAEQGVRCQDCHMTRGPGQREPVGGVAATFGPARPALFEMSFVGANTVFGDTGRAERLLQSAATLAVEVKGPASVSAGDALQCVVTVANTGAGHSLPTGLTDLRRMWLEVTAVDGDGQGVPVGKVEYQTVFADEAGNHDHVPVWFAASVHSDRRVPANGQVVETLKFDWPKGVRSDARVRAELKYMSFPQEVADQAGLGVEVPVVMMASAEAPVNVASSIGRLGYGLIGLGVVAAFVGAVVVLRPRRMA